MASMARATIIGNLGRDAEMKMLGSGSSVLEFSIAVNQKFREQGDWKEVTRWYRVSLWGTRGEKIKPYLLKGKQVYVTGALTVREYTTQDGRAGVSCDLRADEVQLLGSRGDAGADAPPQQGQEKSFPTNDSGYTDSDVPF